MTYETYTLVMPLSDGTDNANFVHQRFFDGEPEEVALKKIAATDDFSDGVMGFPWASVYGSASYLNEADGVLHLFPVKTYTGYDSEVLTGDFDVEFDFTNYSYSGPSWGEFQIHFHIDNTNWGRIGWVKNSSFDMWQSLVYLNGSVWDSPNGFRGGYTSGAFRIARTGSLLQTWHKQGGGDWNLVTNKSGYTTANGLVRIRANAIYPDYTLTADVNNFKFNSGGIYPIDSPSPINTQTITLSKGSVVKRSTAHCPELMNSGDAGSIEYRETVGGVPGSWMSQTALKAQGDLTVTAATTYKIEIRLNSDGVQRPSVTIEMHMDIDVAVTTVFQLPLETSEISDDYEVTEITDSYEITEV